MTYKIPITCIKDKDIVASVVLSHNHDIFNFSIGQDYVIKKGNRYTIDLNINHGNIILINLGKLAEIESNFSKQNLSVVNSWAVENKKQIIGGTDENFSLGKHLLIERKI
jgi:hypothetical protein